jgi:hypothetical protein
MIATGAAGFRERPGDASGQTMKISSRHIFWLSMALFAACLTQDGYYIAGNNPRAWSPAYGLLFLGWLGLSQPVFEWIANPLMILAWFLFRKSKPGWALSFSALAFLFMAAFLLEKRIISDENGRTSAVTGYGLGFWLWLASAAVMAAAAGLALIEDRRHRMRILLADERSHGG